MFEIDSDRFIFILKNNNLILKKENEEYNMELFIGNDSYCKLYLNKYAQYFDINVLKFSYQHIGNKHIIKYLLESDEEETVIEIEMEKG